MTRAAAAALLGLRFARALVAAGLDTAWLILRTRPGRPAAQPGFLRLRFVPLSAPGAALLGCLVTLTPGTTVLDIDLEERELLLHLLDAASAAEVEARLRRDFEPLLNTLFGVPA